MGPTRPICSILTFIGEQEQLKKLSDNFGISKQNKLYLSGIVDSDWKGTKSKENYLWSISVWYVCLCNFQFWNIKDDF